MCLRYTVPPAFQDERKPFSLVTPSLRSVLTPALFELIKIPKNNMNVDLYLCRVFHARLGRGGATSLFAEEKLFVKNTGMNYNKCFSNNIRAP